MKLPLQLGLKNLRRDWRAGELQLLAVALIIAVASVATVGLFKERISRGLLTQASELLAADLIISAADPIAVGIEARANKSGLVSARTIGFRSVVNAGTRMQLVELKAVSPAYPLRGNLHISSRHGEAGHLTREIPAAGTVWLEPRLLASLGLDVGDSLQLGKQQFRIAHLLAAEPDRAGDLFSIAPRLMMRLSEIPATGLVARGSRVHHRLLLAGEANALARFRRVEESRLPAGARFRSLRDGRPELRATLDKGFRFLDLGTLISVCLAAIAIMVTARRYSQRHLDSAALLRCLGASRRDVLLAFGAQIFVIGAVAALLGCILGYLAQELLVNFFGALLAPTLPAPSLKPLGFAWLAGILAIIGFALPPLMALRSVPPARVLNRTLDTMASKSLLPWLAITPLVVLFLSQGDNLRLGAYILAGTVATLLILALASLMLVRLLSVFRRRGGIAWRYGLANLSRHTGASILQVVAFGSGLMLLLLLTFARDDLTRSWRDGLPPGTPNFFLINIQPNEVEALQAFLHRQGLENTRLYPMVRGRLSTHNRKPVRVQSYTNKRARRLALREFNLSWAAELPPDNHLEAGHWWPGTDTEEQAFSVEQGIAKTLGIKLGDRLTFRIADKPITGTVRNLRSLTWDSFRVNFFVLTPPGMLEAFPATYISSFHLTPAQQIFLPALLELFPSVTVVDVDSLLGRIQSLMGQAARGVEYLFSFTLLAGLCVLFATVQATRDERRYEFTILRSLGASRSCILQALVVEFLVLGLVSGSIAALGATLMEGLLAREIFHIAYAPNPWLWFAGIGGGTVVIGALGLLGTRSVLHQPPLSILRTESIFR